MTNVVEPMGQGDLKPETPEERRTRLRPVLDQLKAAKQGAFLDLCELVLMISDEVGGSMNWKHARVVVHIKRRPQPRKAKVMPDRETPKKRVASHRGGR